MAEPNPQLSEALESLEKRLETPVVPGELSSWSDEAEAALARVEKLLQAQIEKVHPKQMQEILQQDPGLAARVEQLQQNDTELVVQLTEVRNLAKQLRSRAERVEPDERQAADAVAALVDRGLQLVIAARKQEAAIATWFLEAFDRDRGDVD